MWLTFISFIALGIFIAYYVMMLKIALGWNKIKSFKLKTSSPCTVEISCIIAFRNEYTNLELLIEGLKHQSYRNFEVILVDDNSNDESYQLASRLIAEENNFKLIKSDKTGKKAALAKGIQHASHSYIAFTDADCILHKNWLLSIAQYLESNKTDLLIGPVKLSESHKAIKRFQNIDFLSLVTSGAGAIGANMPIMCNGANLTVSKRTWLEAQSSIENEYASGDDIFLLQYCKANKKKIEFLKSEEAIVQTHPEEDLSGFLKQRARWASKSKAYTDITTIIVAWVVFLTNLLLITIPLLFIIDSTLALGLCKLALIKIAIDYIIILQGAVFFKSKIGFLQYFLISIIYPIYIISSVIWAAFGMLTWKNRTV